MGRDSTQGEAMTRGETIAQGKAVIQGKAFVRGETVTLFQGVRPLERDKAVLRVVSSV